MSAKKNQIIFLFIASLLFLLACNLGATPAAPIATAQEATLPAPDEPSPGGLCDHELYPIRQGASWTYASTGGSSGDFSYMDTVTELRADGFTLSTQFEGLTRTQEWECDPGGLRALQMGGGTSASVATQGAQSEYKTTEVAGYSYPRQISPGMEWTYTLVFQGQTAMPNNQQSASTGVFTSTMKEAGREAVSVPAGTFDAVRFQSTHMVQVTAEFQGAQMPLTFSASSVTWFAPGVGFVKSIENSDYGGAPHTITTELQAYNIP